jgi:hypothetical protein
VTTALAGESELLFWIVGRGEGSDRGGKVAWAKMHIDAYIYIYIIYI